VNGPYYRAGSWVTTIALGVRTKVGSMLLSNLQEFEVVDIYTTVTAEDSVTWVD
jgi:hypothetical protein